MQQDTPQPLEFYKRRIREVRGKLARVKGGASARTFLLYLLGAIAAGTIYASLGLRMLPVWTAAFVLPPGLFLVEQIGRLRRESLKLLKLEEYYEGGVAPWFGLGIFE